MELCSVSGFWSNNWVPVTVMAGEILSSLGTFLIPRRITGREFIQFYFLAIISVFSLLCWLFIIPFVWG